jgi:uncharacterized membrane protein YgcG
MKTAKWVIIMVLLISLLAFYGKAWAISPPTDRAGANSPPVEQALVPEGFFAIQLVEALKMGQAQDEAQAENMLSSVGIEPKNGWIAGYPVTPPIIGEIEKGVFSAAEAGKIRMGKDEAQKAVQSLKIKLGLSVTPGVNAQPAALQPVPKAGNTVIYKYTDKNGVIHFTDRYETIPEEYRAGTETIRGEAVPQQFSTGPADDTTQTPESNYPPSPSPEVINNYYYSYGPPAVTYYAPPAPYGYLYAWVPYPFWCSRVYYRGYFILHDFHRRMFFHRRPCVVTNHVVVRGRVLMVDPINRALRGSPGPNRGTSQRVFHTPGGQAGAGTIVGLSQKSPAPAAVPAEPKITKAAPSPPVGRAQGYNRPNPGPFNGPAGQPGNKFQAPRNAEGKALIPPAASGRFSNPSPLQVSSPAAGSQSRILSGPAPSGGGSLGAFSRDGVFSGRGGSFGGGVRSFR